MREAGRSLFRYMSGTCRRFARQQRNGKVMCCMRFRSWYKLRPRKPLHKLIGQLDSITNIDCYTGTDTNTSINNNIDTKYNANQAEQEGGIRVPWQIAFNAAEVPMGVQRSFLPFDF